MTDLACRYDASLGGYIFNMQTKTLSPGTHSLLIKAAGDAHAHSLMVQLR